MARQKKKKPAAADDGIKLVMTNRKIRHEYEILDTWEAGMVLQGSEVKSLRNNDGQWADAHARMTGKQELILHNLYIGEYREANILNHDPVRERKLLLNRRELRRIAGSLQTKGLTIVPQKIYFKDGYAKIEICLVRGKKHQDKRKDLRDRSMKRDIDRELARRQKH
ncbi:MAG: SsrA-binding protein SmpB [Planctomycetes bacterium]|nr:SsrA-binding protein SmpB [Planctomycetota bacterium]